MLSLLHYHRFGRIYLFREALHFSNLISGADPQDLYVLDIGHLIDEIYATMHADATDGVALATHVDQKLPFIYDFVFHKKQ